MAWINSRKLRLYFPMACCFFFTVIQSAPFYIVYSNNVFPALHLMTLYFWSHYRPTLLPYWFVFILGLLHDMLIGMPLGVSAFTNIVFCALAHRHTIDHDEPNFIHLWQHFAILVVIVTLIKWLVLIILNGYFMLTMTFCLHIVITVVSYPLLHKMLWLTRGVLPKHAQHQ